MSDGVVKILDGNTFVVSDPRGDIEASLGQVSDRGHDWDDDPAAWVRRQRHGDQRRAG